MATEAQSPKSLAFTRKGIRTGKDFANTMSAMMTDLLEGRISPAVGNAVCNAGGKLLKVVEMQHKYASPPDVARNQPQLILAPGDEEV
jgi:hypothetical protein